MSGFEPGFCPICGRNFRPRAVRMETLVYCSRKCCEYTSPMQRHADTDEHRARLRREWDAIQWANGELRKVDDGRPTAGIIEPPKPLIVS